GFSPARAAGQRSLEQRFDAALDPAELKEWMRRLSARPHHLGSPYGKDDAEFIATQFRSWGWDTRFEEFRALFPTPKIRVMEMVAPTVFRAPLAEPMVKEDPTSGQAAEQLPVYNAYSIDGDVTGDVIYVNYGVPRDYEELERRGIDAKGKIVLARYGSSWRGIKPKVAAEHGAVGCLIYSDPRDDGYFEGDVYPRGPYRNEAGAQRGSVADMPLYPGDPLTPGVGATPDRAKGVDLAQARTVTKTRSAASSPSWPRPSPWARCTHPAGRRSARSSTRRGTARSRGCWARRNGPRPTTPSCSRRPSPTSTPTPTAGASSRSKARTRSRSSSTRWRGTSPTPRPG